jgi:hypothetical protein
MKKVRPIPAGLVIPAAAAKPDPINNTEIIADFKAMGGRVMHFRPDRFYNVRGMTIAFIQKSGRIEVATAVQHRADDFTKKVGTKTAIEHFFAGKTVTIPLRRSSRSSSDDYTIKSAFERFLF